MHAGGIAHPGRPLSDRHDSSGQVIGISVAAQEQRPVAHMAQYVMATQGIEDEKQAVQSSQLANRNVANDIAPIMSHPNNYSTPQKLGLNMQRSIGTSLEGAGQESHQNMQEPESIHQNQSSQVNQASEQQYQYNSAAKLSADDSNFTNTLN